MHIGLRWVFNFFLLMLYIHEYRANIVLHPQHKLQYFEDAGWEPEWIAQAHRIVKEEYDERYKDRDVPEGIFEPLDSRKTSSNIDSVRITKTAELLSGFFNLLVE